MQMQMQQFLNRRLVFSAAVALIVASYGYKLLNDATNDQRIVTPAGSAAAPPSGFAYVVRLFFVTFAVVYVLDYVFARQKLMWSGSGGGGSSSGGGSSGGGSSSGRSGISLDAMLRQTDLNPPRF